jgi:hypothetical protein
MKRSTVAYQAICHWCKTPVVTEAKRTTPAYTDWPSLPAGSSVVVCGLRCPQRPQGAPVGRGYK